MPLASCFGHPPVEPEVTFVSNNKKAPSGSAGGGFLGYPALLAVLSKRFALTQHGADTGLVVAGGCVRCPC